MRVLNEEEEGERKEGRKEDCDDDDEGKHGGSARLGIASCVRSKGEKEHRTAERCVDNIPVLGSQEVRNDECNASRRYPLLARRTKSEGGWPPTGANQRP